MMNYSQISFFDGEQKFKIDKPIRLIELFAGYGSQALALKYCGVNFKHYKISEWAVKSIQAYKDMHFPNDNTDYSKDLSFDEIIEFLANKGISANYNEPMTKDQIKRQGEEKCRTIYNNIMATHNLVSVTNIKGKDLEITDTHKYCYIMSYSFPCQDLSNVGLRKGMDKDSDTRSSLLWEVEKILEEIKEQNGQLPQVLLMENVPEVIGSKNIHNFAKWVEILDKLGYKSKWQVLNAKDYNIPQNRNRCFMISVLGDYYYDFPNKIKLKHKLKDLLEDNNVDEKYYITSKQIEQFKSWNTYQNPLDNIDKEKVISPCLLARGQQDMNNGLILINENLYNKEQDCNLKERFYKQAIETLKDNKCSIGDIIDAFNKKVNKSGICPTLTTRPEGFKTAILPIVNDNTEKIEINLKTKNHHLLNMVKNNKIDITKTQAIDLYNQKTNEEIIHTIRASVNTNNETVITHNYRIRKLTPKECFRLMGVKDEDFERVRKNQSNSSLYHLAGDSIVVNVLEEIFKKMI